MAQTSINTLTIAGGLTSDVAVRGSGKVATADIAVTVSERNRETKQYEKHVEYFTCKFFSRDGKLFQYLKKGTQLTVTGALRQEKWTTKEGANASRNVIYVNQVNLHSVPADKKEAEAAEAAADAVGAEEVVF